MVNEPLKVLVVDDDAMVRDVLETLLRFDGCDVKVVENGEEGLEAAAREPPDVVLLDVMMPGMDGFEVCRKLKSEPDPPKVVMVTAKTTPEDEREARESGADEYLRKPFSPLELLRVIGLDEREGGP